MLVLLFGGAAQGASFRIVHNFCEETNCTDGQNPLGHLTIDAQGNLYGTANGGGAANRGTLYELKRGHGRQFTLKTLYSFCDGCQGGQQPISGVIRDTSGNLYGMTELGGASGKGVAYKLTPRRNGEWTQTVLQTFTGSNGSYPYATFAYAGATSGLPYDGISPLYGTTLTGGTDPNAGTMFALTPDGANWTFETIFNFSTVAGSTTGARPTATPVVDAAGNVFGTAGSRTVYMLVHGDEGWSEETIYNFCSGCNDNTATPSGLTMDAAGALVGGAGSGGPYCTPGHHGPRRCGGGIYKLTPDGTSWDYTALYDFCAKSKACRDGKIETVAIPPVVDASGNVYGTASDGGKYGFGVLFRIRTDGVYEVLHDFCKPGDCRDGLTPDQLVMAADGSIYGITVQGGPNNAGALFEFQP